MENYESIVEAIQQATKIVITSHKSPDGDSIGSSLALYHFIQALKKEAIICHPDEAPGFLKWMQGADQIHSYELAPEFVANALETADLIFCLDYNSADRVGKDMQPLLEAATGQKIMIDHHLNPSDLCSIVVSETSVCSTAQLIFELIDQSGHLDLLNETIAEAIYLGIMTDTGSFRFPSVQARTHEIAAKLIGAGLKHHLIHENVFDTNTLDRLRLRGYVMSERLEIMPDYPIAIISVTDEELQRFNHVKGDTEGLVNVALSIEGIKVAAFFSEKNGEVKISFRSKGAYEVNVLAHDHFDGGGHKYAAGGINYAPLLETVNKFKSVVPNYFK